MEAVSKVEFVYLFQSIFELVIKPNMTYIMIFVGFLIGTSVLKGLIEYNKQQRLRKSGIAEIDEMKGDIFENYLGTLLGAKGYKAEVTQKSGDYGADLVLRKDGQKIVVQAKRYKNKVGVRAVQEIVSAKNYYKADSCWVITNNYFTQPAITLAKANNVRLINRDELINWMLEVNG